MVTEAPRQLDVAIVQEQPVPGDVTANVHRVVDLLGDHPDAEVALFPELFLSGYHLDIVTGAAVSLDSEPIERLCAAAARHHTAVIIGFPERDGTAIFNSLLCVDSSGTIAGVYRKTHLFGPERHPFTPGDRLEPITVDGLRVGPVICFDIEFPEVGRTLALQGIDIFVAMAANPHPYYNDHRLAGMARALDNRIPLLYSNLIGNENGLEFAGGSRVVSEGGDVVAECSAECTVLRYRLELPASTPEELDYLTLRRPDLYRNR